MNITIVNIQLSSNYAPRVSIFLFVYLFIYLFIYL